MPFLESRSGRARPLGRGMALFVAVLGCAAPADPAAEIGAPLPGLSPAERARFQRGAELFGHVFTPEEGVGPLFNENQCSACHTSPVSGGTGDQLLVRMTRFQPPDGCDPLTDEGGENVRTQATPLLRAAGMHAQPVPRAATERGEFAPTFLFGLGLLEAVTEAELLRRADPEDRDGDGISGRAGRDAAGRLARFGRKADVATIADFVETALRFEMGLTTSRQPHEPAVPLHPYPAGVDPAADPEISDEQLALLTDFVRFLAPPPRRQTAGAAARRAASRGEELFGAIGCAACHTPALNTGPSEVAALDRKRVHLYSDLLLHDLGDRLANVCAAQATPTELRTAPLMGLSHRSMLLHDGRTNDLFEAIELHGGEATAVRERFRQLPELDRHAVIAFLRTL